MDCLPCLRSVCLRPYTECHGQGYNCELLFRTPGFVTIAGGAKCGGKEHI